MGWLVLLFACSEPPEPERCDGLDNDQDGIVDEAVVGFSLDMPRDEVDAPELDHDFRFSVSSVVGVVEVENTYEYADGSQGRFEQEFDSDGNLLYSIETWEDVYGRINAEISQLEYEDGWLVFERYESWLDESLLAEEQIESVYNEDGLVQSQILNGAERVEYQYDEQDRLIEKRSVGRSCKMERWEYPSDQEEMFVVWSDCDDEGILTHHKWWDETGRLTGAMYYDSYWGQLIADYEWVWDGDLVVSRVARNEAGESMESRSYKGQGGRYSRVELDSDGEFWNLVQNSKGILSQVEVFLPSFNNRAVLNMDRRPGSNAIERIEVSQLSGAFGSAGTMWWKVDLDLDEVGNLLFTHYTEYYYGQEFEQNWTYACAEEE